MTTDGEAASIDRDDAVWRWWLPILAAAATLALALPTLGSKELWYDEAFSVTSTNQLWSSLTQRSGSMAVYYSLLTPWSRVSLDPAWLRLPSAAFMAAAVAVTSRFALRFFGRRVAIWTTLILLPMFGVTRYAQEARSYALVMLLAVVSWYLFFHLAQEGSKRAWIWWGVCSAALVYSHPLAGLIPATQFLVMRARPSELDGFERRSALGWITFVVLLLPMAATFGMRTGAAPGWVPPLGWSSVGEGLTMISGPPGVPQTVMAIALVAAALWVMVGRRDGGSIERWRRHGIVAWLLVTPTVLALISLSLPMIVGRYLIAILPAAALLLALAVADIGPRSLRIGTGVLLVAVLVPGLVVLNDATGHRWTHAAALIESEVRNDEVHGVVFNFDEVRQPFEVNAAGMDVLSDTVPLRPAEPWGSMLRYHDEITDAELGERAADVDVLWEVAQIFQGDPAVPDDRYEFLGFCPTETSWFSPGIEVTRFDRCP